MGQRQSRLGRDRPGGLCRQAIGLAAGVFLEGAGVGPQRPVQPMEPAALWEMGLLKADDWKAHWITGPQNAAKKRDSAAPVPILRKEIKLGDKPIASARLFATALGLYELRINGQRVGDHCCPGLDRLSQAGALSGLRCYAAFEAGRQRDRALLGNGWYCGHIGNGGFQFFGKHPALSAQLEVTYADGSVDRIVTDSTWKTHASPVMSSDFMLGENYDAREEMPGWDQAGLNDGGGRRPPCARKRRALEGQVMEPVRETGELPPKSIKEPKPGLWIFDLGQNMVGVVRLKVSAPAGTKSPCAMPRCSIPTARSTPTNLRGAPSIDTYICKGAGVEIWQPRSPSTVSAMWS